MSGARKKFTIESSSPKMLNVFIIFLIVSLIDNSHGQAVELKSKNPNHLQKFNGNVYVVDLKAVGKEDLVFYCSSSLAIDLNFTYSGFSDSYSDRIPAKDRVSAGRKQLTRQISKSSLSTGFYTCTSLDNRRVPHVVSYEVYFYPNDGKLFLSCGIFAETTLCPVKVQYRLKSNFTVPCKALHPDINVDYMVNDLNAIFTYNHQIGFTGSLIKDERRFKCVAKFDAYKDEQQYDLSKIDVSKLEIIKPDDLELVRIDESFSITVMKNRNLELTCQTTLNCDYYDYAISFRLNTTNDVFIDEPVVDRANCAKTRLLLYKRTITISKITENFNVNCDIIFGKIWEFSSKNYLINVADHHFITYDQKNISKIDYFVGFDSFASIRAFFNASSPIAYKWFFKGKAVTLSDKFVASCTQLTAFEFTCDFDIYSFSESDAGIYSLELQLKHFPNEIVYEESNKAILNTTIIWPKKPDLTIVRPDLCSANYTCEINKNITFTCKAHAHLIDHIFITTIPCENLEDCYGQRRNSVEIERVVDEADINSLELVPKFETSAIIPSTQPHLVICAARNEIGRDIRNVIMFPSDLERGKLLRLDAIPERANDNETVEGDLFKLKVEYHKEFYDRQPIYRPSVDCKYTEKDGEYSFTKTYEITFDNISIACIHNYSVELISKTHPYLNKTKRILPYYLNVLTPIAPYFITLTNLTNDTVTPNSDSDKAQIYSDSDKTISLNCKTFARPEAQITWLKNSEKLNLTEEKFNLNDKGMLKIIRTHSTDTGTYKCIVTNRAGSISREFEVNVKSNVIYKGLSRRQIVGIIIVSITAVILLILLIIAVTYVIIQKKQHRELLEKHKKLLQFLNPDGEFEGELDEDALINANWENLAKLKFDEKKWEVEPTRFIIDENHVLGEGNFGRVCIAFVSKKNELRTEDEVVEALNAQQNKGIKRHLSFRNRLMHRPDNNSQDNKSDVEMQPLKTTPNDKDAKKVAVKMVKDQKVNSPHIDLLLQELKIMGHIGHHVNIVQLVGCCTSQLISHGIVYVFVEFCERGDLRNWLRSNNHNYSATSDLKNSLIYDYKKRASRQSTLQDTFNDLDLVFFCYQIAKGMEHLAKNRFLHRDLAARNVLIGKNYELKISDFGLADESKLSTEAYFGNAKNTSVPVKWSPPEVLNNGRFEANSDVWSFGITMWEIFTLAQTDPFPNVTNMDFMRNKQHYFDNIEESLVVENGPEKIREIMLNCCTVDHLQRTVFPHVVKELEDLMRGLSDAHLQYYEKLKDNFKQQCNYFETFNRDLNRASKPAGRYSNNTQSQYLQPSKNVQPIKPIENKKPQVKPNQNNTANTYLEPINNNPYSPQDTYGNTDNDDGYLEPLKGPANADSFNRTNNNNSNMDDGYLEPTSSASKGQTLDDTYGNFSDDNNGYMFADHDESSKPLVPPRKPARMIPNLLKDDGDDDNGTYLLPRHGSNVSSSSVESNASNSSTTPLKFEKANNKRHDPKRYQPTKFPNSKNMYVPPNITETDI